MRRTVNYYLLRFNRVLVWLLLPFLVTYVLSGYGIVNPGVVRGLTGGILTCSISLYIHINLASPILVVIMIHILIEFRFALIRLGLEDGVILNRSIVSLGLFLMILLMLMNGSIV